ncbi:MAG: hypothetical protein PHE17_06460 [Thiothrix sp.]|jgi:hypothetical protein|uniref:hypothetical protein n=1 Tax=Thiothrix sp. TaxID=1032 RepID=UPI0026380A00|nr:hypothetical protein [Thiothrix sp.]MDD5392645.1 hypothetical protein [Thiothrix sp.]
MVKRNLLPDWYPARCHRENLYWDVPQWIRALSHRSQLVRAETEGCLAKEDLEAAIIWGQHPVMPPVTFSLSIETGQPDALLFRYFAEALEAARKRPYSPAGSGICQNITLQKSKFKLLSLMDGLGKLHHLRVLDWIDLSLWSRLSGITLETTYLGDIFWSDEEIDRRYRLATSTRPLACQLVSQSVIYSLSRVGSTL